MEHTPRMSTVDEVKSVGGKESGDCRAPSSLVRCDMPMKKCGQPRRCHRRRVSQAPRSGEATKRNADWLTNSFDFAGARRGAGTAENCRASGQHGGVLDKCRVGMRGVSGKTDDLQPALFERPTVGGVLLRYQREIRLAEFRRGQTIGEVLRRLADDGAAQQFPFLVSVTP